MENNGEYQIPSAPTPSEQPGVSKKKLLYMVGGLALILLIAVVIGYLTTFNDKKDDRGNANAETSATIVTLTNDGFEPDKVLIKKGSVVKWVNETNSPRKVGANPYPSHEQLPDLLSGDIAPGDSYSFTFTSTGTFGYSDYTNPTAGGEVEVR